MSDQGIAPIGKDPDTRKEGESDLPSSLYSYASIYYLFFRKSSSGSSKRKPKIKSKPSRHSADASEHKQKTSLKVEYIPSSTTSEDRDSSQDVHNLSTGHRSKVSTRSKSVNKSKKDKVNNDFLKRTKSAEILRPSTLMTSDQSPRSPKGQKDKSPKKDKEDSKTSLKKATHIFDKKHDKANNRSSPIKMQPIDPPEERYP